MTEAPASRLVDVESCQVCGSPGSELMFAEDPYRVLRCTGCRFVYVTPRLADDSLHEVYGEAYWQSDSPKTHGYANYTADEPLYLKTFARRLRFVHKHLEPESRPDHRVLDVGCAAGYFLRVMQAEGHDIRGVELSPAIAKIAREHLGKDRVHVGTLDDAISKGFAEPGSFDMVTMWDVIEHVPDPQQLLREVHSVLKPDGVIILETQNVDSKFAKILGKRWQHYKHQEHLYHFNPATIARILTDCGFEIVENTPKFGGKYVSFSFIAERAARLNRVAALVCKPLGLFKNANVYLNFRDEMVVVAKRSDLPQSGPKES